jgi:hypothetical protein
MERTPVDSEQFDGLARTVADREEERANDREQFDALIRLAARKGSRRMALAGLLGAALLGRTRQAAEAQCRGKEGKNKRQCRRREREQNAPGGLFPCQEKLNGVCALEPLGSECCNGLTCTPTFSLVVLGCQFPCRSDDDCHKKFPNKALACRRDDAVCPRFEKCCVPR